MDMIRRLADNQCAYCSIAFECTHEDTPAPDTECPDFVPYDEEYDRLLMYAEDLIDRVNALDELIAELEALAGLEALDKEEGSEGVAAEPEDPFN